METATTPTLSYFCRIFVAARIDDYDLDGLPRDIRKLVFAHHFELESAAKDKRVDPTQHRYGWILQEEDDTLIQRRGFSAKKNRYFIIKYLPHLTPI